MTPRERAWNDIHDLLPERWQVGPAKHSIRVAPLVGHREEPEIERRLRPPATITGEGADEVGALTYLGQARRRIEASARWCLPPEAT